MKRIDPEMICIMAALMCAGGTKTPKTAVADSRKIIAEVIATQPKEPQDGE
jgi:hypothetical protein